MGHTNTTGDDWDNLATELAAHTAWDKSPNPAPGHATPLPPPSLAKASD